MRRILEDSPVKGYQLFRYQKRRADGTTIILPNYYIRYQGKDTCTGTDRLKDAKTAVKKKAGEDAQTLRKRAARPSEVNVGTLLDLVIEDYKANGQKTIKNARGQIDHSLRPYFGGMVAAKVDTDQIKRWMAWRQSHRLRRSIRSGHEKLQPASINRELSLLRRAYQLGYEHKPQLVEKIPPIKRLAETNIRKGFVTAEQYRALMKELPEHLKPITCVAFHVANRKGELLNLRWEDVDLSGDLPLLTLWPGETKNKNGRTLPILEGEMLDTFKALKKEHDEKSPDETHVFLNAEGKPLAYHMMRKVWDAACTRAGFPGLLFHDLRRSAVRNLRRAGVSEKVAREFSGHRTGAVFSRYDISDFEDLKVAAKKLKTFLDQKNEKDQKP